MHTFTAQKKTKEKTQLVGHGDLLPIAGQISRDISRDS